METDDFYVCTLRGSLVIEETFAYLYNIYKAQMGNLMLTPL